MWGAVRRGGRFAGCRRAGRVGTIVTVHEDGTIFGILHSRSQEGSSPEAPVGD